MRLSCFNGTLEGLEANLQFFSNQRWLQAQSFGSWYSPTPGHFCPHDGLLTNPDGPNSGISTALHSGEAENLSFRPPPGNAPAIAARAALPRALKTQALEAGTGPGRPAACPWPGSGALRPGGESKSRRSLRPGIPQIHPTSEDKDVQGAFGLTRETVLCYWPRMQHVGVLGFWPKRLLCLHEVPQHQEKDVEHSRRQPFELWSKRAHESGDWEAPDSRRHSSSLLRFEVDSVAQPPKITQRQPSVPFPCSLCLHLHSNMMNDG